MTDKVKDKPADEAPAEVSAFKRSLYYSASPLPLQILRMSHTGQVLEDGIKRGTASLIGSIVGLPRDLYEFGRERWTGEKRAAPKEERVMSSDWISKKLENQIDDNNKYWTGKKGPEIREGTLDKYVHGGGQVIPIVGSFFVPGAGQAQLATIGSKLGAIGKAFPFLGRLGAQLGLVEGSTMLVEGAEYLAGVDRPTEAVAPKVAAVAAAAAVPASAASSAPASSASAAQAHDLASMATTLAEKSKGAPQAAPAREQAAIQKLFSAGYLADPVVAGAFDPDKVKALQSDLVASGHLKPTARNPVPVDGVFGSNTVGALDASVRATFNPEAVSPAQKKLYEAQMRLIAIDIRDNPPSVHNFDSRVLAYQVNAYALGLYDGRLDGLKGEKTDAILTRADARAEGPKQGLKAPEMSPM